MSKDKKIKIKQINDVKRIIIKKYNLKLRFQKTRKQKIINIKDKITKIKFILSKPKTKYKFKNLLSKK